MGRFLRGLFWLFAPFILLAAGIGLLGLGLDHRTDWLVWIGGGFALTGFGWGAILVFLNSAGGFD